MICLFLSNLLKKVDIYNKVIYNFVSKGSGIVQFAIRFFGIVGLILCVIPFQFKKHKHIVLCKMFSELSFAFQYILMGAYTGALVDLISGFRNFLFCKFVEKGRSTLPVIIIFSSIVISIGVFTWSGVLSVFPVLAKVLTTVSYGMKNEKALRLITLPSCIFWIIYNFSVGGWEALIGDFLAFCSIIIAIYKFDIKKS